MGFMDKARAAASDLAAKADTALASSGMGGGGDAGKYFHDLGVLTYLSENGRPASAEDRERVMAALRDLEARGAIHSFALQTAAAAPPPPPPGGAVPPPSGTVPPPAPGTTAPPPPPSAPVETPVQEQHPPTAPPPPPPSWAGGDAEG